MKANEKIAAINKAAALKATSALSKMIGQPVNVIVRGVSATGAKNLATVLDHEEITAAIYLPITGDIDGAAVLLFPQSAALALSDLVLKKELGTTKKLSELDRSALQEVGNIVCGNYLTTLSNMLEAKVVEHVPDFSFDMFGAIIDQIIAQFAGDETQALVVAMEFHSAPVIVIGHFVLLFKLAHIDAILESAAVAVE